MSFPRIAKDAAAKSASDGSDSIGLIASNAARNTKAGTKGYPRIEMPSYDTGIDRVPEDQIALIHEGEKVVPADENPDNHTDLIPEQAETGPADKAAATGKALIPESADHLIPEREERGTPQERAAIKTDIQQGMGKGKDGLTQLGMAKIHENLLAPAGFNQGAPDRGAVEEGLISPFKPQPRIPGLRSILTPEQLASSTDAPLIPTDKADLIPNAPAPMDHKAKLADYDKRIQDALDEATPASREKALLLQEAKQNYLKSTPWGSANNHPGILGKLGHVAEMIASRAPGLAPIMATIPGTEGYRAGERNRIEAALPAAETAATAREGKETPKAKLLTGEENVRTDAQGNRDRAWQMPDGSVQWVAEGQTPETTKGFPRINLPGPTTAGSPAQATPAAQATIGTQPNVATAAGAITKSPAYTYGKAVPLKEGEQPATASELADVDTRVAHNPYIPQDAVAGLRFPEGYTPTQNDVKERLANIKEIEDATRQGKQDEFNNGLRKLQEENGNLIAKARLQELEEKQKTTEAKNAQAADVSMVGLYSQEHYKDAMKDWYKSGSFAKDSGLITEIVDKEHSDKGAFSGVVGDALVGSLLGPEGAALGAGVGALTGLFSGPANGYLSTLKKQGISDEGYNAMQAYFNALPARMSYEIGVQGVSASALRSSQLIQKVLNTIPSPNTPQSAFDSAFRQYYKPMETLTKGKIRLTAPKGYEPPSKEAIYPAKEAKADAPPAGATHTGVSSVDGKEYYLDAQGKKLGLVPAKK